MPRMAWIHVAAYRRCSGRAGAMIVAAGLLAGSAGRPRTWQRSGPWRAHKDADQAHNSASIRSSRCLYAESSTGDGS